jgi:catechol 2,3-dioxygenase-like lactoylglutathione lyase family enzyme
MFFIHLGWAAGPWGTQKQVAEFRFPETLRPFIAPRTEAAELQNNSAKRSSGSIQQKATLAMHGESTLGPHKLVAFVATRDSGRAKAFYRDTLGLRLVSQDEFALVFDAAGTMLRITNVQEVTAAKYTVLGWQVPDIVRMVKNLQKAYITLERYPGMQQDKLGIWNSPSGARVAWFKDPDGNTLSITQF